MIARLLAVAIIAALLGGPVAAAAQPAAKVWRIGWLSNASPTTGRGLPRDTIKVALRERGYVEGQNVSVEFRWAEDTPDRLSELARALVRHDVDVIVAVGPPAIRAAQQATTAVPIVMMTSGDPVGLGFVRSLAHPGGNVTGVSFLGEELSGKLLELLKQAVPRVSRVAVVWNPGNTAHAAYWREVRTAAKSLGVTLQSLEVGRSDEFARAFERATQEHADALLFLLDPLFSANSTRIADLAKGSQLPTIYGLRQLAEAGGLMAYGPSTAVMVRHAASYVDRILKGAEPGDLPVEQPTKFELVINANTARALGVTIPPAVLARADELIQ